MTAIGDENEVTSTNSKIILEVDAFPFKGLKISQDWEQLDTIEGRTLCPLCKKSRKYFCYTCYVPVPEVQHFTPKIKLPIKIDIVKHAREMDGKSTAVHAAVLAPEDVRIFTYPCIPDYPPEENVVLIFPNKDAVSVEEVCETFFRRVSEPVAKRQCREDSRNIVHRAVFIDSTWNQSRGIFKDPRIKSLPSVVLKSRLSQFWRHQADSPRWYLATIEAIHQFLVELDEIQWRLGRRTAESETVHSDTSQTDDVNNPNSDSESTDAEERTSSGKEASFEQQEYIYKGQYDNLLFLFRFMYSKIHALYEHEQLKSYKRRLV